MCLEWGTRPTKPKAEQKDLCVGAFWPLELLKFRRPSYQSYQSMKANVFTTLKALRTCLTCINASVIVDSESWNLWNCARFGSRERQLRRYALARATLLIKMGKAQCATE